MSIDVYVGPYINCAFSQKTIIAYRKTCADTQCLRHYKELSKPFCDHCGKPTTDLPYKTYEDTVDARLIQEQINERLCSPGNDSEYGLWSSSHLTHLWIPNRDYPGQREYVGNYECLVTPTTARDIQDETVAFMVAFEDDIKVIKEAYGQRWVHVLWGVISIGG